MARARHIRTGGEHLMRIHLTSVFVDDQAKAERFYTEILGFVKKHDVPVGEKDRWLTVVSPDEPGGTELLLEYGRSPGRQALPRHARRGRHPSRPVRRRRRQGGVRAPARPRCGLHPGTRGDGPRHHRRLRRHLRQPDPDRDEAGVGDRPPAREAPGRDYASAGFTAGAWNSASRPSTLPSCPRTAGSVITPSVPIIRRSTGILAQADSTMSAPV